jgi:hypothetical protein
MSNNYWEDEDDEEDTIEEAPMDGSDLLKKLRKAKRADEKRIKELTDQLEGFSKAQREAIVKSTLEKKGVNQKAARLIMKDLEDINEDSVSNWLNDNADLFGLSQAPEDSSIMSQEDRAALRNQDALTQNAVSPDRANDLEYRMSQATSEEDILAILRSQQ